MCGGSWKLHLWLNASIFIIVLRVNLNLVLFVVYWVNRSSLICYFAVVTGTPNPSGSTPAPVFTQCDFDSGTLCGWTQASDDQFDWTVHQKNTGTSQTGPSYDHTTGSNNGKIPPECDGLFTFCKVMKDIYLLILTLLICLYYSTGRPIHRPLFVLGRNIQKEANVLVYSTGRNFSL